VDHRCAPSGPNLRPGARVRIGGTSGTDCAAGLPTTSRAGQDFAGAVDFGGGREICVECRGVGSPTVVLISDKGNGARDPHQVLDATDLVRDLPTDEVLGGKRNIHDCPTAVFPTIAREARVCSFDRPNTRSDGNNTSTPRAALVPQAVPWQPTTQTLKGPAR